MGITNSEKCKFCNEMDYIEHFFWGCKKVQCLWIEIQKDIKTFLGINIYIDERKVLLGAVDMPHIKKSVLMQINHVIALGKMVISKFRYGPQRAILEIYETDARIRKIWEAYG